MPENTPDNINEIEIDIVTLDGKLQRLVDALDVIKDRQEQMALDISKIKEAVYNPDQGLYARIRALESWKNTSTRLTWIIVTSLAGLGTATIWNMVIGQCNFKNRYTLYSLRSTHISNQLLLGISVNKVAKNVGTSMAMIQATYDRLSSRYSIDELGFFKDTKVSTKEEDQLY